MSEEIRVNSLSSLPGMTVRVAQQCLAAVSHDMPTKGVIEASKQGVVLTEDDVFTVAGMAMDEWGLNLSREARPNCYLCGDRLPKHGERFCDCVMTSIEGVFMDTSRENLQILVSMGRGYQLVASCDCRNCGKREKITASRAWGVLAKNKHIDRWVPRPFCVDCHKQLSGTKSTPPPRKKGPAPVVTQRMDLKSLQQAVAAEQPTINA